MPLHADAIRLRLAMGPKSGSQIAKEIGLSQPTVARALATMRDELAQMGQKKSTRYVLRDTRRGFLDLPVYRVDTQGLVRLLGVLVPARPDGFVFNQTDGRQIHSEGLPWWLLDMRPQGFLGRAYAARYGASLGLPNNLREWSDSHGVLALLVHGHDVVGNLLLGDVAKNHFISMASPACIAASDKAMTYIQLAQTAAQGDLPGSSAGGEQPKFMAYAQTDGGAKHVMVKFTEKQDSPVSERWRDLLLAEHWALHTLQAEGVAAARSEIVDSHEQRFLEVTRFDREGAMGRRALMSLTALDAEFVGQATEPWPVICQSLAQQGAIDLQACESVQMLWAFGRLIGNTDMHNGNLSFVSEHGRPYALAPAYDMTPMAFAPTSSGQMHNSLKPIAFDGCVSHTNWHRAQQLAERYLHVLQMESRFSPRFQPCLEALAAHVQNSKKQIDRLG